MQLIPTHLALDGDRLQIQWSDSTEQSIKIQELRKRCPCANCRDQRAALDGESAEVNENNLLKVLPLEQAQPLRIEKMEPAGNYAYTIRFSDGHSNGLFTFEFLRSFDND